ncbi:MAG: hypothetical protein GXP30_13180, partial [Verrucomicrobia bacterium]|nr:hypothetical protein [Verrucomicrobiota bacterium]
MKSISLSLRKILYALTSVVPLFCQTCPASAETQPSQKLTFERYPSYYSSYSNPLTPKPSILLRFNAPIDIEQATQNIHFSNEGTSPLKIPVTVIRPSQKNSLKLQPYPAKPDHQQNFSLKNFLLVQPLTQLPTGHRWKLIISKGFASSDKKTTAATNLISKLGRLEKFKLNRITTANPYDAPRTIQLSFNKKLHSSITAKTISQYVKITPEPKALKFHRYQSGIGISGGFYFDVKYQISVTAGLPATDQTFCQSSSRKTLVFSPNAPFVHLPAFNTAQNLSGEKKFAMTVGNTKNTLVRIKKLTGKDLIFALRGYGSYLESSRSIPFEMVPGRNIYKKTWHHNNALDHSEKIDLNWDSLIDSKAPGAYYFCAEASSKARKHSDVGAQALIQLTDIGLAWKKSNQQT